MLKLSHIPRHLAALGPFLGLAFVYLVFFFAAGESFHSLYNTKTFICQTVIIGIGALGMTLVIIAGGIDLSVGSMIALGTVVSALVLKHGAGDAAPGVLLPVLAAGGGVAACAVCGCLNGAVSSLGRIVPFIVTLGMMQIIHGTAKWLAEETTVNPPDNWLNQMMIVEPQIDVWYSVAPGVWVMVGLTVLMAAVLRYTTFGRHVFAIGSNEATARLCGIRVRLTRIWVYTLCGVLTGVASVMQLSNLTIGDPAAGDGMELNIIAAVVIGGGSLNGGEGSVLGSLLGALMMAVLRNGCNQVDIPTYVQNIVIGAIIILAVGLDGLRRRGT